MKYRLAFIAFFFLSNCFVFAQNTSYAIQNVTVIPMNRDVVLTNQTVLVEQGIISKINAASAVKIPKGVTVIDY